MQDGHAGKNNDLTGSEGLDYWEVARIMSDVLGRTITYRNPNPFYFLIETVRRGTPFAFALIMMGLYTSTRFGMAEPITTNMKQLTGRDPIPFKQYVRDYQDAWRWHYTTTFLIVTYVKTVDFATYQAEFFRTMGVIQRFFRGYS